MRFILLAVLLCVSGFSFAKEAQRDWNGKYQSVTFMTLVNHQPVPEVRQVRWIALIDEHYVYQDKDGSEFSTSAKKWQKDVPGEYGDILAVQGTVLTAKPGWKVIVACSCNGELKSQHYVKVAMDGGDHAWPDDK